MSKIPSDDFFNRVVTVHRHDCIALAGKRPEMTDLPGVDGMSASFRSEQISIYAAQARVAYEGLRRLVGQLAGFLVLARVSQRRDILDFPELGMADECWVELYHVLQALVPPAPVVAHKQRLEQSHKLVGDVLGDIKQLAKRYEHKSVLDRAGERIKLAYQVLQTASDDRAGLAMVDFTHACCSCSLQAKSLA